MRQIVESESFKEAVRNLGGHRVVDEALEPIIEALYRHPYGFEFFQNDWVSFRYTRTRALEFTPPLVVIFTIEPNGDVILQYVEEDQDAT